MPSTTLDKQFTTATAERDSTGNTFTLTVGNTGTASAANVQITDAVDARLTVTSVAPAAYCGASSGQSVDCTFPTIGVGGNQVVTVTYSVGAGVALGTVNNTADAGDGFQTVQDSDSVEAASI